MPDAARMSRPLLLGHRGARACKSISENTIASFDQALADGCDGFEFDVRLTADEEAVVCHDPKAAGFHVSRATAKQLSHLPRLRDVLQRYRDSFLDIELKVKGLENHARPVPQAQATPGFRRLILCPRSAEIRLCPGRQRSTRPDL